MKKKCFIITPIGEEGSEIRKNADGLIESIIKPVLAAFDYEPIPAHKISESGSITNQIISHLIDDDLVIANLTGLNLNVFYELAVRHAAKKPVVCIAEKSTKIPFDIVGERYIPYEDNIAGTSTLIERLKQAILENKDIKNPVNPISQALSFKKALVQYENINQMANKIQGEQGDVLKIILEKLTLMEQDNKQNSRNLSKERIVSYEVSIDIEIGDINVTKYIIIHEDDSVQSILDHIYFLIDKEVSPGEYMKSWVLKEKTKGVYLIMYEITNLIPASLIFQPNSSWKVIKWDNRIIDTIHQYPRRRL